MMTFFFVQRALPTLSVIMLLISYCCPDAAARGGGGGFRGGGGGFGGGARFGGGEAFGGGERYGGGERFGGSESFGRRDTPADPWGRGFGGSGVDRGWGNDMAGMRQESAPRVSESDLRSQADKSYNWGGNSLATDAGFARLAAESPGTAAARVTNRMAPSELASLGTNVRGNYAYGHNVFNRDWWRNHPGYWPYGWGNTWAWGWTGWPALAGWWGVPVSDAPIDYDYGDNITYQNNTVYYGSQPEESADEYYTTAQTLATSCPVSTQVIETQAESDWKPLGVFSLVQGGQTDTTMMFQLAVNKAGAVKGTYYNALTGETQPLTGAVDKKRGRVAWTVGNNTSTVYDTGLSNLMHAQSPILVHFGASRTQQMTLVRLQQPTS